MLLPHFAIVTFMSQLLWIYNVYPNERFTAVYIPSGPREIAATPVRDTSTRPSGSIRLTNWSILSLRAGDLEDEALDRGVDHARPEGVGEPQRLDPVLALAAHLDHRELALDRGTPESVRSTTRCTCTSRSS